MSEMSGKRAVSAVSIVFTNVSNLIVSSDATWRSFLSGWVSLNFFSSPDSFSKSYVSPRFGMGC